MIGIIFRHDKLNRIAHEQEVHENISFYYQLAEQNKVNLLLYSLQGISLRKRKTKGLLYSYAEKKLSIAEIDLPKMNILRTIIRRKQIYRQLKWLENRYAITFINMIPERNKYKMYQYLSSYKDLQNHLPDTKRLTYKNLLFFIQKYQAVVIKPVNGARGEKIFKITREEKGYIVQYIRRQKQRRLALSYKQILPFLQKYLRFPSTYLVQRWIPFKEFEGDKFDIRISVQMDKQGIWKVTGMVARAAAEGGIVTNIAQGGRAISFQQISPLLNSASIRKMKALGIEIAKIIAKQYPSTVDLGLDLAIDQEDRIWFIEANHCDEKYAYYESKDLDMWQASYTIPFEYAYAEYCKS